MKRLGFDFYMAILYLFGVEKVVLLVFGLLCDTGRSADDARRTSPTSTSSMLLTASFSCT